MPSKEINIDKCHQRPCMSMGVPIQRVTPQYIGSLLRPRAPSCTMDELT